MITTQLSNDILNHVFRGETYTRPENIYLALFTSSGEVDADEYSRMVITFSSASNGRIESDKEVRFPVAVTDWGTITQLVLYDSETGGTKLSENDVEGKKVEHNEQLYVPSGSYDIEVVECD